MSQAMLYKIRRGLPVSGNMLWTRLTSGSSLRPCCVVLTRIRHERYNMSSGPVSNFHSASCLRSSSAQGSIPVPVVKLDETSSGLIRVIMSDMKTRNALSLHMMSELIEAISRNKSDVNLRAITIEAVEGPVFSAGHNLKELTKDRGPDAHTAIFSKCTELMTCIRKAEVPVIGVVRGLAAAAGCQLISACDFAIASDSARFSTPGASFGLFCSTPGIGISRVLNQSTSAFMVLTGMTITAQEALQAGLVTKVVPESEIESQVQEIYSHIKSKSRPVLKLGKEFFYQQLNYGYEEAMKRGEAIMVKNLQLSDCQEGLSSFKEKRKPNWTHEDF